MNEHASTAGTATPPEPRGPRDPLCLAQQAFEDYYLTCFWFMDRSLRVTEELLPRIAEGLRRHGDRKAFQLAEELCH